MQILEKHQVQQEVHIGYQCDNCGRKLFSKDMVDQWHIFHVSYWDAENKEEVTNWRHTCSYSCYYRACQTVADELKGKNPHISGMHTEFMKGLFDYLTNEFNSKLSSDNRLRL